jgi:hypothetical protein
MRGERPDFFDADIGLELDRGACPVAEDQVCLNPQLPKNFQQADAQSRAARSRHTNN